MLPLCTYPEEQCDTVRLDELQRTHIAPLGAAATEAHSRDEFAVALELDACTSIAQPGVRGDAEGCGL